MFGPNWVSNFEERIFVGSDNYIKYLHDDGNFWSFGYASSNWVPAAPVNAPAVLTQNSTNWVLTFKNGEQRLFSLVTGMLSSIVDRNGNTTTLTYDGLNRLTTVTDPASRHLTFTYTGNTSYQVASVNSDAGLTVSYSYNGNGLLTKVAKPDGSTLNFQYDTTSYFYSPTLPNPDITSITDGNGKLLESHTYDCYARGLSSSRAGGVESVTVTYSDGTYTGLCGGGRVLSEQ
jgi:YD repeat-containing protein